MGNANSLLRLDDFRSTDDPHRDPEAVAHRDGSPRQNALKLFSSFSRGGCAPSFSSLCDTRSFFIFKFSLAVPNLTTIFYQRRRLLPRCSLSFFFVFPRTPFYFCFLFARANASKLARRSVSSSHRCLTIQRTPPLFFFNFFFSFLIRRVDEENRFLSFDRTSVGSD